MPGTPRALLFGATTLGQAGGMDTSRHTANPGLPGAPPNVILPQAIAPASRQPPHRPRHQNSAGPRPNVYATASAPGLVLATGNVGAHLDYLSTVTCTYLSRDGGQTWEDILDGPGESFLYGFVLLVRKQMGGRCGWAG